MDQRGGLDDCQLAYWWWATRHIYRRANQTYMAVVDGGILSALLISKINDIKKNDIKNVCAGQSRG